jgi:hypothetical protein
MLAKRAAHFYSISMVNYSMVRNLEVLTSSTIPESMGVTMAQAIELARAASTHITLASGDTEPFIANLPTDAPDYHSYHDVAEIAWRVCLSRGGVSGSSLVTNARSSSTYIWNNLTRTIDPKFFYAVTSPSSIHT